MNRQNQKRVSLIVIFILFFYSISFCQDGDSTRAARVTGTSITLVSEAPSNLKFKMGIDFDHLIDYIIKPNEPFYSEDYASNPVIKLYTTTKKCVRYSLVIGKTYQFYWNEDKIRWDVREVKTE